jgi:hypothetical protein
LKVLLAKQGRSLEAEQAAESTRHTPCAVPEDGTRTVLARETAKESEPEPCLVAG